MLNLMFIILTAVVSLALAAPTDKTTFQIHTNDADFFSNIDVKAILDFANSEEGRAMSADGTGLNVAGLYHLRTQEDLKAQAHFLDLGDVTDGASQMDQTSSQLSVQNSTVSRTADDGGLQCLKTDCEQGQQAVYGFRPGIVTFFQFACSFIVTQVGNNWQQAVGVRRIDRKQI